jgi:GNAT superfamily N-acetyltransferase
MIRRPRPDEIKLLPQIENAADQVYARVGPSRILGMPPATISSFEQGRRENRLWVSLSPLGRPVGFALMKWLGGHAWLDQLSVLDAWQGRGLGTALIERTAAEARARGHHTLHLSTYRDVSWNGPFYARRGFEDVPRGLWPPTVRRQFMIENSHGHPPWRRTIMRRGV